MDLVLIYELFTTRNESLRELQKSENAIIRGAGSSENHNFVHAGLLALAGELQDLWAKSHEMDRRRAEKWFWQVKWSDVSERCELAKSARNIRSRLWTLEQGLFHLLPPDFVAEVQARMAGKRTTANASIKIARDSNVSNVHTLPVTSKRSTQRFAQPARVLEFPRKSRR